MLERFQSTSVILGAITIASSKVESVEYIINRLQQALNHIDHDRLLARPDCGLMMLGRKLAMEKLSNMCQAAQSL